MWVTVSFTERVRSSWFYLFIVRCGGMRALYAPLALALIVIIACTWSVLHLTEGLVRNDGMQNYRAAYNLVTKGSYSHSKLGDTPTMLREPLPSAVLASWIWLTNRDLTQAAPEVLDGTPGIKWIKGSNILWLAISILAIAWATMLLTQRWLPSLVAAGLAAICLATWQQGINSMYTEIQAGSLLVLCSAAAIELVRSGKRRWAILFGLLCGALALTKAISLFVFIVAVPILALITAASWSHRGGVLLVMALACSIVVGPWVARNYYHFGQISIAERGGRVLYYRSMLNLMPQETWETSFYVWTPERVRPVMEALFGFRHADLEAEGPGRFLNRSTQTSFNKSDMKAEKDGKPEMAVAYIWKMRAEYRKRVNEFKAANSPDPHYDAQTSFSKEALQRIKENPFKHLKAMLPLFWHGMWVGNAPTLLSPLLALVLPAMFIVGIIRRRTDFVAFTLMPLGTIGIYLLISHNLPRYIEPEVPAMFVGLCALGYWTIRSWTLRSTL